MPDTIYGYTILFPYWLLIVAGAVSLLLLLRTVPPEKHSNSQIDA